MKNFNFFEKLWEHSRTLRRVGLVLVMCLVTITQAYASDPHFHLTGKTPTGSWSNSATEWKLSSPASSALSNGATFDEYCTYMWLSEGDYFGLNNGTDRYSRNDNNDQEIKGDKYGAGVFGYPTKEGKTDKAFHYIGATGLVRINAAQTGSGDSYGNQGQYYPYIWVEESLETDILNGSKIMFYFGIADRWNTNWFYLSKEGDQSANKAYKQYFSMSTRLETRIAVAYVDANTTYYIASAQSGGTCIKMSSNAAAGNLYSLNSSGGNNIYVNTGNVPHFATTSVSKEVGTTNSTIAATDANSIYGNAYTFHYYYTTDGGSTFTKFDPTDISDLTTGRYIVYALGWDGHILVKSDNSVTLDITVPITLNANGGSDGAVTSINATYGVAASTGNIAGGSLPTKTDYVFTGFYTSGGTKVIDADGEWVSDVSGYTNAGGNWTCTAASTLYAHWEDRYGFYGTGGDLGSWDVWKGLPNTATNTYSKSYSLTKNTTYIFKIVDRNGSGTWWGNSNTSGNLSITRSESGSAQQLYNTGGKSDNITITPDVTGSYTFSYNSSTNKLTITYPESYKVTYHNNGSTSGSVPTDDDYYLTGATVTAKDNTGKLIASESGKVFAGWNTASDGSGAFVDPADTENNTFTISSTAHDLYPVWKDGYYLITPGGTSFNLTPSAPFTTGRSIGSGSAVSVNGISSAYWWTISGSSSACNVYNVVYDKDRHLLYDTQTDDEDIYVYVRGTGNLHYAIYKEGEAYTAAASDTVAIGAEKVFHFSIQHSLKSRLVLSASSTSPKITNIRVVKNGSALAAPCTAGYQLSFPGRAGTGKNGTIDGITLKGSSNLTFGTGNKFEPSSSGSHYAQFTTTGAVKLQVTTTDTDPFYVCTDKSSPSTTGVETGGSADTHSVDLSVAGTYYITPKSSNQVDITKIAFAAITSCTAPSALAASDATTNGITLTVTDESTQDYEFYVNTSSTPPTASSVATHSVDDSKSLTIDNLSSGTTYYAWARTKCDYFNKSSWVALTGGTFTTTDACSAPTSPTITGTTNYTAGETISLTASATGTSGSTTYTWYKGDNWAAASATSSIGSAATYTKASCVVGDAGTYWCNISNGDGCDVQVSKTITVVCVSHSVNLSSSGSVTGGTFETSSATVCVGETATLTATPSSGYTFTSWSATGTGSSLSSTTTNPATLTMGTADVTVNATFTPILVATITLNKTETTLTYGGSTETLSVTSVLPANALDKTYTWSSSNDAVATVTSGGVVSPVAAGSCNIYATANDGGGVKGTCAVTVNKADLSVTATAGTATSVTYNSATLPFTLSSTTGVASVTLKVYDASDDSEPIKTVSGVTAATSGSGAVTGLSASTTYYFTVTPIGDSNHNNGSESDKSEEFTTEAAPTLTAISANTLYQAADMATITLTSTETAWDAGLSSNNLFKTYGSSGNTAKGNTITPAATVSDQEFTSKAYIMEADNTSSSSDPTKGAIEFITPSKAGKLLVYTVDGSDSKLSIKKKGASSSTTTNATRKTVDVDANTHYFINGAGSKRGLYGIYYDKAPEFVSSSPADEATDVSVSGTIVLTFDESIASVDATKFTLTGATKGAVAIDGSDATKVNVAYSGAAGEATVTLSVAAEAVTDAVGNKSAALSSISFTTENTGYAITNADPDNGTIAITDGLSDITEAEEDAKVYIAATPETGYEFTSWDVYKTGTPATKVSTGSTASTSFTMPAYAVTVDATFTAIDYDITHSDAENGTYTISVAGGSATDENTTANYGQTITLAATPSSHYKLQAWNVTKTSSGDEITVTDNEFTMLAEDVTIAPTFGRVYTVTFRAYGGSSVSPIEQSTIGGSITMPSTTTSNDSTFTGWMIGGTTIAAGASYTPTADVYAYATWQKNCAGGGGSGSATLTANTTSGQVGYTNGKDSCNWKINKVRFILKNTGGESSNRKVYVDGGTVNEATFQMSQDASSTPNDKYIDIHVGTDTIIDSLRVRCASNGSTVGRAVAFCFSGESQVNVNNSVIDTVTFPLISNAGTSSTAPNIKVVMPASTRSVRIYKKARYDAENKKIVDATSTQIPSSTTSFNVASIIVYYHTTAADCYHLTYDGNGADAGYENDARAYSSGDNAWVSTNSYSNSFTREGYEFNGWNNKADGTGTDYDYWTSSDHVVMTQDTTLYAQWRIIIDEDNTNVSGFETPQYKDVAVRNGATLTITEDMSVRNITVESGSTLHVAKNGEEGVTFATKSLSLKGGYYTKSDYSESYDMPRVYIDPASKITRTNKTINFDFAVTNNYHPIAVPFPVKVYDVNYVKESLAYIAEYGNHYNIKTYDGAARANGSYACWTSVPNLEYVGPGEWKYPYLEPGRGYILAAKRGKGDSYALIRFPMKNVEDDWLKTGELGHYTDGESVTHVKDTVRVTAYLKEGDSDGSKTPKNHKGWNILGIPYMSCYQTSADMYDGDGSATIMQGRFDFDTNTFDDKDKTRYVSVPTHDFSEYLQYDITDEDTKLLPGWCFFVQIETTGRLTFVSEKEMMESDLPYRAPKRENASMPTVKTGIILSGAGAKDKTTILVSDKYNGSEYEINADLEKMFGETGYTLATYSLMDSTRLAYNAMSNADIMNVIPVGYRAPEEGEYTFSINPRYAENFEQVNLIDYETGILTNLLLSSYTFSTERTQNDARFALNVVPRQDTPTDVENVQGGDAESNKVRKVLINDKMYIILDGKMYDATGKKIK